ncbi:MAG TPA: hypothetical protein VFK18_00580 [Luteimonas sp.]|nr:hypothetical protein [Luteimonas sp.]
MSFEIIPVWQQVTPELKAELVAFWERNKALGGRVSAEDRAAQAVCIGRDEAGTLCAVGTAALRVLPRLRQPTYYYRQFFDAGQRGQRQTVPFVTRVREVLQAYNAAMPTPESLGLLVELENRMLNQRYTSVRESGFTFIGYSPRGLPLFVSWFDNAKLLPPVPLPRGGATPSRQHGPSNTGIPA